MSTVASTVVSARPRRRRSAASRLFSARTLGTVVVILAGILFAFPIALAAIYSFKATQDILGDQYPLSISSFLPLRPTLENYQTVFGPLNFQNNIFNTLIAATGQVLMAVVCSTLAGYAFARLRFPGRDIIFSLLLLASFVSVEAILVPLYSITHWLGLTSTYVALFLPFACNPFGIYLMRQSFREIPVELEEAARLDGANVWRIFFSIALPNVLPALATLVLIQFIWAWNAYLWPVVIMQDPGKQIAQVALANMKSFPNFPMDGPLFAGATVITIPLVIMAIFLQKYYVRGLSSSGMK
jgi:ABC-type glycerol-3-phosphate transport system permease component